MQPLLMANPQDVYRKQGILTASPIELIIMLYDGLRKNILLAERAINKKDVVSAHNCLMKAQAIVAELMNALDLKYEISGELMALYEFMMETLQEINVKKETNLVASLLEIVSQLRETWQEIGDSQKGGNASVEEATG